MATEIIINPTQMRNLETEISGYAASFETLVTELKGIVDDLSKSWEGDSHNAFVAEFAKDIAQYHKFKENVDGLVKKIENSVVEFEKTESKNVTMAKTKKA